jgi:hypothetical protein
VVDSRDPTGHTKSGYLISAPGETRPPLERPIVGSAAEVVSFLKKQGLQVRQNGIWLLVAEPGVYTRDEAKDIEKLKHLCKSEAIPLFICRSSDYPDGWERFSNLRPERLVDAAHNYCMQRTAGRLAGVFSQAALAGRR